MLSRLGFPSIGPHRRFVTAIAVDAVGSGVYMPVSMLYFLAVTPLSLVEVGAAISIAAFVALPSGPVIGALVDRIGAKRVLLTGNLLQVAGFTAYLFVDTFITVLAAAIVAILGMTSFWGAYGNIVAAISKPGERERWFGFLGALRNVGFAIGGLASGVAVAIGSELAFSAVVAVNAVSYAVAFWLLLAVPEAPHERQESLPGNWGTVLRDGPFRLLVLAQVGYSISIMILIYAIPVYAVEVLELPGWVSGVVFTVNCVMVGFGQGLVVNALTGHVRFRVLLLAQATFATSYVVFLLASELTVWLATAAVIAAGMVYTLAEMMGGPVLSATAAEAAPEHLRGRYLSLIQLAWMTSGMVAPVLYASLLASGPAALWLVMLGVCGVAGIATTVLGRVLPEAGQRVTNLAEESPATT